MTPLSGMANAGRILILIGAILACVGAVTGILGGLVFASLDSSAFADGEMPFSPRLFGIIYLVVGLLSIGGAITGFMAYGRAQRGDVRGAWVLGLVSSLLPPLQVVTLVGAILCKVSPEGESGRGMPQ